MQLSHIGSIHQKRSAKKYVLRNFTKFSRKHLCESLFFNKKSFITILNNNDISTFREPIRCKNTGFIISRTCRLDSVSQVTTSLESFSTLQETSEDETITSSRKLPIDVTIGTPIGRVTPDYIYKSPDGNISVKFPREEIGAYLVNMVHKVTGKHISGSHYEVEVTTKIKQKKKTK